MRIVLLAHPSSLGSASMPRFAGMIQRGMTERGHTVEVWTSRPALARLPVRSGLIRKWLGYGDQFLFYPRELARRMRQQPADALFVVADQALGMWVPHLVHRPHVIHCHDFIALRCALGEFPPQTTGWTGRQYQRLIRKGFSHGKAFISVSGKTQEDLHRFLPRLPEISKVVYNGLNHSFQPMSVTEATRHLTEAGMTVPDSGFILHVGGNQWYKNRVGVLEIYRAYAAAHPRPAALWMVGARPSAALLSLAATIPAPGQVRFLSGWSNEQVNAGYCQARALLFPSLEEGFGWPIVEAMASDCVVITTDAAPLNEVAGNAARLIPRMPANPTAHKLWAQSAANTLNDVVCLKDSERAKLLNQGRHNAARFNTHGVWKAYETIYERVLAGATKPPGGDLAKAQSSVRIESSLFALK